MSDAEDGTVNRIDGLLSDAFAESGEMVTKWIVLAETFDEDGQRGIWTATNEGALAWDTLGMLTYAVQREQARIVIDIDD